MVQNFPECSSSVGAHQHLPSYWWTKPVIEGVRDLGDGLGEGLDVVVLAVGPGLSGANGAAAISRLPFLPRSQTVAMNVVTPLPARERHGRLSLVPVRRGRGNIQNTGRAGRGRSRQGPSCGPVYSWHYWPSFAPVSSRRQASRQTNPRSPVIGE